MRFRRPAPVSNGVGRCFFKSICTTFVASLKIAVSGKININTATAQQLSDGLDGIGAVMAKRIVEYRAKNGSFHSIDELKKVSGIGDKTFEKLKDHVTVDGN